MVWLHFYVVLYLKVIYIRLAIVSYPDGKHSQYTSGFENSRLSYLRKFALLYFFEPLRSLSPRGQTVNAFDSHPVEPGTNLGAVKFSFLLKILVVKFCEQTQCYF